MTLRTALAAAALTAGLVGVGLATAGPALACGDAPGLCPNPPDTTQPAPDNSYIVGVGGDF